MRKRRPQNPKPKRGQTPPLDLLYPPLRMGQQPVNLPSKERLVSHRNRYLRRVRWARTVTLREAATSW